MDVDILGMLIGNGRGDKNTYVFKERIINSERFFENI